MGGRERTAETYSTSEGVRVGRVCLLRTAYQKVRIEHVGVFLVLRPTRERGAVSGRESLWKFRPLFRRVDSESLGQHTTIYEFGPFRWVRKSDCYVKACDAECWQAGDCTGACRE